MLIAAQQLYSQFAGTDAQYKPYLKDMRNSRRQYRQFIQQNLHGKRVTKPVRKLHKSAFQHLRQLTELVRLTVFCFTSRLCSALAELFGHRLMLFKFQFFCLKEVAALMACSVVLAQSEQMLPELVLC